MDKKGVTLNNLYPALIAIIVVSIGLGIGLFVLGEMQTAISTTSYTVTNETLPVGDPTRTVATADNCGFNSFVITEVINETDCGVIPTTNYTYDTDTGVITQVGPSDYNLSAWNVSYTYKGPQNIGTVSGCSSMSTTETGLGGFASCIAVIVVVLAAAVVLGIVISSFGNKTQGV